MQGHRKRVKKLKSRYIKVYKGYKEVSSVKKCDC